MTKKLQLAIFITLLCLGLMRPVATSQAAEPKSIDQEVSPALVEGYGNIPLHFEPNQGQVAASEVDFIARSGGYTVLTTPEGLILLLPATEEDAGQTLRVSLEGANPYPQVNSADLLPGVSNYLLGNDPTQWRTNVPNYQKVRYAQVWDGIDLVLYGNQKQLEYDFVVAPGANPDQILLHFDGIENLQVDEGGNLTVSLPGGRTIQQTAPVIYQEIAGARKEIEGRFVLSDQTVRFEIGEYNAALPLVIDPILVYSTFLGSLSFDESYDIAVDGTGNAYIVGNTNSDYPITAGAYDTTFNGLQDIFVTKLNASGSALVFSTYIGGSWYDSGHSIALDSSNNIYVAGTTDSNDFPTTSGAFDRIFAESYGGGYEDAFVLKLNASGSALVYSTYLGGGPDAVDYIFGLAVDNGGSAYVTGQTNASNFPTTAGAYDRTHNSIGNGTDAFVTKLNASGSGLVYSTFLGGNTGDEGLDIAVDSSGNAYVAGGTQSSNFPTTAGAYDTSFSGSSDAFVTKVNASGSALVYSTFIGANGAAWAIDRDTSNNVYIVGFTSDATHPTTSGAYDITHNGGVDVFVTKLNAAGTGLVYSTFVGGSGYDAGWDIDVDSTGKAYITGQTDSTNFPVTSGAYDTTPNGSSDAFVTTLTSDGAALFDSSYLGGSNDESGAAIVVDNSGDIYISGTTGSAGFPVTSGAYDPTYNGNDDAFVAKMHFNSPPTISNILDQVTNEDVTAGPLSFTLGDVETAAGSLTVSGSSSNQTLVPDANVVFGGSGASRTVTLIPAADQSGTATITITVTDGEASAFDTFLLTVTAVNDTPTIASITDQVTDEDVALGPIGFTIADMETAASSLSLSATSSDSALVPVGNVVFGGSGANRTVTVTPALNQSGSVTITLIVSDGQTTADSSFLLTVHPVSDPPTISNIPDQTTDEDTPRGPISFTISDAETVASSLILSAASSNLTLMPLDNIALAGNGTNRTVTLIPADNQSGSAAITVTVSDGDLSTSDSFVLTVNPVNDAPTISPIPDQLTAYLTPAGPITFTVGDVEKAASLLTLSAASSNPILAPTSNIVFGGSGAQRTVTITPTVNEYSTTTITLTVSDGSLTTSDSFVLTVNSPADDTDGDGMTDGWEVDHGLNPMLDDAGEDPDHDGLTNHEESLTGTDPHDSDSDDDSMLDGWEVDHGLNPLANDAEGDLDSDGQTNLEEYLAGTDPHDPDSDDDGWSDGWEIDHGFDPSTNDRTWDSDHDGLSNYDEYQLDTDWRNADTDGDTIGDGIEVGPDPTSPRDSDHDGTIDARDIDSDGDSVPDRIEGLSDADNDDVPNYLDDDSDGDGIADATEGQDLLDTDDDGILDYLDLDSDSDSIADAMEGEGDMDLDGIPNYRDDDSDGDGILDGWEKDDDPDNDGRPNYLDRDSDNDGILDILEGIADFDHDGIANYLDPDSDDDGIADAQEGITDSDGDGVHDYLDLDSDADSVPDAVEGIGDFDRDGIPNYLDDDSDNDGIVDLVEGTNDSDGDQIPDYLDLDSDADNIADTVEGIGDFDGDGVPNYLDDDSDGDGIADSIEDAVDADGDHTPNYLDLDSDSDGVADKVEGIGDLDEDGVPHYLDDDSDGDGIADRVEGATDADADHTPNYLDLDSDGDGIADSIEGTVDADEDEVPNFLDDDSDGDGIADRVEGATDTDGDHVANYLDLDSDGDGIADSIEGAVDADGDEVPNYLDDDSDGDGIADSLEGAADADGDQVANYLDLNSDGDGIADSKEGAVDADGDHRPNFLDLDSDGDGIADCVEGTGDLDGDGIPNYLDSNIPLTVTAVNPVWANGQATTTLTIIGTGYVAPMEIKVGAFLLPTVTLISTQTLHGVLPVTITPGIYDVTAIRSDGQHYTKPFAMAIGALPPIDLSAINPVEATNEVTVTLTLTGSGFSRMTQVKLGDQTLSEVTFVTERLLRTKIPANLTPGAYDIKVISPDSQSDLLSQVFRIKQNSQIYLPIILK